MTHRWLWRTGSVLSAAALLIAVCALIGKKIVPSSLGSASKPSQETSGSAEYFAASPPGVASRASLAGSVVASSGQAVVGARVCATCASCEPTAQSTRCVETDGSGTFVLADLSPSSYRVAVSATGFEANLADGGRPVLLSPNEGKQGLRIVLQKGGVEVAGTVVDATGGFVPSAVVRAVRWQAPPIAIDVTADPLGRFAVWMPRGAVTLVATADGYAPARVHRIAPTHDVELVLTPGGAIRGVVVTGAEEPVVGAEVRALRVAHGSGPAAPLGISGPDGTFTVEGLEPDTYQVVATGPAYRGQHEGLVVVGLGQTLEGVTVHVSGATRVSGRVLVASSGASCEAGMVVLGPPMPGVGGAAAASQTSAPPARSMPVATTTLFSPIGPAGGVQFDGVPPGRYFATVQCQEHTFREGPAVVDVGTHEVKDLEWRVERGSGLAIHVVDDSQEPVPGARILLQWPPPGDGSATPAMPLAADSNGRCDVPTGLGAGHYVVKPFDERQGPGVDVTLQTGMGVVDVTLGLHGAASILVDVQGADGKPVGGVRVQAVRISNPTDEAPGAPFAAAELGEGRYRIAPIDPGRYRVDVDDGVNPPVHGGTRTEGSTLDVPAGAERAATVTLAREREIRGRVIAEDGGPAPNVWVTAAHEAPAPTATGIVLSPPPSAARVLTDLDGNFLVDKLVDGVDFTVRAEQPGGGIGLQRSVRAGSRVELRLVELPPAPAAPGSEALPTAAAPSIGAP